ncbi:MAG: hypothetical protein UR20_C0054G0015 [Candidatus Woesebacteria bacterium GW2011_GWE2_31_6]|nr:MAG: hypothetical protein UR20_C0054G0015 [Candidatus Woesebacteria bacterium GW2011_GWE2_31_6]
METKYEIEHHFELEDMLPAKKQVMPGVKIVKVEEKGEFLVERDLDNRKNISLTFGGLVIKLSKDAFNKGLERFRGR